MSEISGLRERMRQATEERERLVAEMVDQSTERLEEKLRQHERRTSKLFAAALSTIERDTEAATERLTARLRRAWAIPLIAGLSLCLGISLGSWGLTQWLWSRIDSAIALRVGLEADVAELEETKRRLEEATWGLRLTERPNGRFAILPPGAETAAGFEIGGRPALRLSRPSGE